MHFHGEQFLWERCDVMHTFELKMNDVVGRPLELVRARINVDFIECNRWPLNGTRCGNFYSGIDRNEQIKRRNFCRNRKINIE